MNLKEEFINWYNRQNENFKATLVVILFFVLCTIQGVLFILLSLAGTDFNLFNQSILNVLRESFVFRFF